MTIPPLRAWPDIEDFISRLWIELGGADRDIQLSPALLTSLAQLPWPGNVRQLRSLLRVLLALADEGEEVTDVHLPAEYRRATVLPVEDRQSHDERLISETLQRFNGNISKTAEALGVARSTLYRRAARDKRD